MGTSATPLWLGISEFKETYAPASVASLDQPVVHFWWKEHVALGFYRCIPHDIAVLWIGFVYKQFW